MLSALIGPVTEILGKVIPDKNQAAKLAHEISTLAERQAHENAMGQMKVNQQEAAHRSVFVAGWRPFIGWSCGASFVYHTLILHIIETVALTMEIAIITPDFDDTMLWQTLAGMLGLGGLRTYEKFKGVTR